MVSGITDASVSNGFKIAHINVNGIRNKTDQVSFLMSQLHIDIMCIGETRLNDNVTYRDITISGYDLIRHDRTGRTGGGVCIYLKTELSYKVRSDILTTPLIECIWIELVSQHGNTLLCCIYRPPNAAPIIHDHIVDTLEKAISEDKNVIIIGDLNYEYLQSGSDAQNPICILESLFLMTQLICEPTRVTTTTSSLLDIILTNVPNLHTGSGVFKTTK